MDISKLQAGDSHYMAYVGPPGQYDFVGATQFRLLSTLGLRADHSLLDFGCGSLRAGRLFLSYYREHKIGSILDCRVTNMFFLKVPFDDPRLTLTTP